MQKEGGNFPKDISSIEYQGHAGNRSNLHGCSEIADFPVFISARDSLGQVSQLNKCALALKKQNGMIRN